MAMSEDAKKAAREYAKKWRAKNPDKVKAINARYWEKKAAQAEAEAEKEAGNEAGKEN